MSLEDFLEVDYDTFIEESETEDKATDMYVLTNWCIK